MRGNTCQNIPVKEIWESRAKRQKSRDRPKLTLNRNFEEILEEIGKTWCEEKKNQEIVTRLCVWSVKSDIV